MMQQHPEMDARSSWLWEHIGRLSGLVLGMFAFAFVAFLAVIGFRPALFLLVLVVSGVAMIAIGGRMRGTR